MTGDAPLSPVTGAVRLPWHRPRAATQASLLVLGLVAVFLLSLAHDEIVALAVAEGLIGEGLAERAEIGMGLVLFVVWGGLTVRLVDLVRGRPAGKGAATATDEDVTA
jgi:hypothetical protein